MNKHGSVPGKPYLKKKKKKMDSWPGLTREPQTVDPCSNLQGILMKYFAKLYIDI